MRIRETSSPARAAGGAEEEAAPSGTPGCPSPPPVRSAKLKTPSAFFSIRIRGDRRMTRSTSTFFRSRGRNLTFWSSPSMESIGSARNPSALPTVKSVSRSPIPVKRVRRISSRVTLRSIVFSTRSRIGCLYRSRKRGETAARPARRMTIRTTSPTAMMVNFFIAASPSLSVNLSAC